MGIGGPEVHGYCYGSIVGPDAFPHSLLACLCKILEGNGVPCPCNLCTVQDVLACAGGGPPPPPVPGDPCSMHFGRCCGDDTVQCGGFCPYWWESCEMCFPCVAGGGGGNTFNYIPPIGVSGPPGDLYHYVSPDLEDEPQANVKEVYPFMPGTLVPWCPGECPGPDPSTVFIKCPQKCSDLPYKWAVKLGPPPPCDDTITVQLGGWNLADLFSPNLISDGDNSQIVPKQAWLGEPNLFNKNIGSNPIRSLGPDGWYVVNNRGLGIVQEPDTVLYPSAVGVENQPNKRIILEWQDPNSVSAPGDYLQVAVGSKYGTIIHSNAANLMDNLIDEYTFNGSTGLNEPDYSSLFFWPINGQIVYDNGLLRDDKKIRISARNYKSPFSFNEFNIPYYISSASTTAGDVFATLWSNTKKNPYRSFGMNLYYLKDDPSSELNGITWQLNGGTAQKQAYGIRPDLILWKFAHQLYPEAFTRGYTNCEGFTYTNQQCDGREWSGFMGQTFMEECDSNQVPTSLYYKQVSLSSDFALVTLAHYEPQYDEDLLKISDSQIHEVGRQVWENRREQARWLFMISTTNEYRTVPLINTDTVTPHSILDPVKEDVRTRLLTFNEMDTIHYYGFTLENGSHVKIPDYDNDVCRFCNPPVESGGGGLDGGGSGSGGQTENNYIINPLACMTSSLSGFTSCFKEEIEFGDSNHPIWNTKTDGRPDMPYVYVLDALAHAKTFDNDAESASWDWIDANTLNAVLSWTDRLDQITKKFVKLYEGDFLPWHDCLDVVPFTGPPTNYKAFPPEGPWCSDTATIVKIKGKNLDRVTNVYFSNKPGTIVGVADSEDYENQILTVKTPLQFDVEDQDIPVDIKLINPPCKDFIIPSAYTPLTLNSTEMHGATWYYYYFDGHGEPALTGKVQRPWICASPTSNENNVFQQLIISGTNISKKLGINKVSLQKEGAAPILADNFIIKVEGAHGDDPVMVVFFDDAQVQPGVWKVCMETPCQEKCYELPEIPICEIICKECNHPVPPTGSFVDQYFTGLRTHIDIPNGLIFNANSVAGVNANTSVYNQLAVGVTIGCPPSPITGQQFPPAFKYVSQFVLSQSRGNAPSAIDPGVLAGLHGHMKTPGVTGPDEVFPCCQPYGCQPSGEPENCCGYSVWNRTNLPVGTQVGEYRNDQTTVNKWYNANCEGPVCSFNCNEENEQCWGMFGGPSGRVRQQCTIGNIPGQWPAGVNTGYYGVRLQPVQIGFNVWGGNYRTPHYAYVALSFGPNPNDLTVKGFCWNPDPGIPIIVQPIG